ncbi:MAG: hypothetical protein COA66_01815 [Arcobacter sp.]|nr:MAG: hypothetical protein COA66_01815 [Arcobacter sp.]
MDINNITSPSTLYIQRQDLKEQNDQVDKKEENKSTFESSDNINASNSFSSQDEYKDETNNIKAQLNSTAYLNKAFLESHKG